MKRFFGLFIAGLFVASLAQPASASTYERWHPNCESSAKDKAECVRVQIYLFNRAGADIAWDRIHASINADECRITLTNGTTKLIAGKQALDVDSATWYNVGRAWHMPKACPVQVHARHPGPWYAKDEIYYFNFDGVMTEKDVCWRLDWQKSKQGTCADVPE